MNPGDKLGVYEIVGRLGAGGMGEVYRARDPRLERDVAIKVLPAAVTADAERLARLQREAVLLASLNHPNIATIHSFEETDGTPFLVLELIDGEALDQRIRRGPLPVGDVVDVGRQVADALEAAHAEGIVHRDLKPANVLITSGGRAKVVDFGIAKARMSETAPPATAGATELTTDGTLLGTAPYMSPEQIRGDETDRRTDIWAFGCLLFEALSGVAPFQRQTLADTLAAVLQQQPDWDVLPASAPAELTKLLRRCLQKDARNRLHDIADARIELDELAAPREVVVAEGATAAKGKPASRWALPMGAALIAALGFAGYLAWPSEDSPPPAPAGIVTANHRVLSTFPGGHRQATFNPDGTMIAFVSDASGNPEVWIKALASGEPTQITSGQTPASSPSWSPRGDQIVFARAGDGIWSVGPLGSPPPRRILASGSSPSFSSDGARLVFQWGRQIGIANADGGGAQPLEGVPGIGFASVDAGPSFSPDGAWIGFFRSVDGPLGDFWVVSSGGGQARRLTFDAQMAGTPVWTPDGRSIVFSSAREGSRTLWSVPFEGGEPQPVTQGAGEDTDPAIAPGGGALVYTNARNRFRLMFRESETTESRVLLDRPLPLAVPEFSPSGERVVFFQVISGGTQVFTIDRSGQDVRQMTHDVEARSMLPSWSWDGESILYFRTAPEDSWRRISTAGGESVELFPWRWNTHPRFDPQGQSVLYAREAADGRPSATLLRDLETGDEAVMIEPRLFRVRWAKDGSRFAGLRGSEVVVCTREPGDCRALTNGAFPAWSADGSTIYFSRTLAATGATEAWAIDADGGNERFLFDLGVMEPSDRTFDVSPDGSFVWVQYAAGRPELWLAELR